MTLKPRTCKWCKQKFTPDRQKQTCCSIECAESYGKKTTAKAEAIRSAADRKTIRIRKEAIKTRSQWMKEAQIAFNAWVRERDKNKPCISCGKPLASGLVGGGFDCGHYRSVGSAGHLRFGVHAEFNAHGQCKQCNRYGSGRAVDYRIGLISRIGIEAVEALESDNEPRKFTIDDLKQIISTYKSKLKELKLNESK